MHDKGKCLGRFWQENRSRIIKTLHDGDTAAQRKGSNAFIKAAKAGEVERLTGEEASDIVQKTESTEDEKVRVNVLGGIAAILRHRPEGTEKFHTSELVENSSEAGRKRTDDLSINGLLILQRLGERWPSGIADEERAIETCIKESISEQGTRAVLASITLGHVANHDPEIIGKVRNGIENIEIAYETAKDQEVKACTAYCLGRTLDYRDKEYETNEVAKKIASIVEFAAETTNRERMRAMALEALVSFTRHHPEAFQQIQKVGEPEVSNLEEEELEQQLVNWINDTQSIEIAGGATLLQHALTGNPGNINKKALKTIEIETEHPGVRKAAKELQYAKKKKSATSAGASESRFPLIYFDGFVVNKYEIDQKAEIQGSEIEAVNTIE